MPEPRIARPDPGAPAQVGAARRAAQSRRHAAVRQAVHRPDRGRLYPDDERQAHAMLDRYAELRGSGAAVRAPRTTAADFVTLLKKRLFSSPAAFARHARRAPADTVGSGRSVPSRQTPTIRFAGASTARRGRRGRDEPRRGATEDALDSRRATALRRRHRGASTCSLARRVGREAKGRPDAKAERAARLARGDLHRVDDTASAGGTTSG